MVWSDLLALFQQQLDKQSQDNTSFRSDSYQKKKKIGFNEYQKRMICVKIRAHNFKAGARTILKGIGRLWWPSHDLLYY